MWMIPSELTSALRTLSRAFDGAADEPAPSAAAGPVPLVPAQAGQADVEAVPDAAALSAVTAALLPGTTTVDLAGTSEGASSGNGAAAPDPDQTPAAG